MGGIVTKNGPFDEDEWITLDVTSAVKGNGPGDAGPDDDELVLADGSAAGSPARGRNWSRRSRRHRPTTTSPPPTTTNPPPTTTNPPPTTTNPPPSQGGQPSFPIRAAFYYPWFPEAWNQQGINPYTKYTPTLGSYRSNDPATIQKHIRSLEYGLVEAVISSWWGQGTKEDTRFPLLLERDEQAREPAPLGAVLRGGEPWRPDVREARHRPLLHQVSLRLRSRLPPDRRPAGDLRVLDRIGWLRHGGPLEGGQREPQLLRRAQGLQRLQELCEPARELAQYGPAKAADRQAGYSYAISPGFNKADEGSARLGRDLARFQQNVRDMVASAEPWQLVTTFNEWGEGTSVESAAEWASASGHGKYLDALHNDGRTTAP